MSYDTLDYDAIVIGAGFGGIYQLHMLRDKLGLRVKGFEKGSGVGGTWFWNRYPGAMSDTESPYYRYSFDEELLEEWDWTRKYLDQPDILAYIENVVDRLDVRKEIQLNTEITGMTYNEDNDSWTVTSADGKSYTSKYVVTALGLLAATNIPDIPGINSFEGRLVHTAQWPDDLSIKGKRVGVIGTGSTGTQFIVAAAKEVGHLTVFQRNAQYSVPSGNGPASPEEVASYKKRFPEIWEQVYNSGVAFGFQESTISATEVTPEERNKIFQDAWDRGNGFYFMFGTFADIATSEEANQAAADFIKGKIKEIVKDPETARLLTPTLPYAKRPLCNSNYYDVYNQDNVELVSILENPIVEITPKGVKTADGVVHELDVIVLATGFDAVDGNYRRMNIRGRGGVTVDEHWKEAPTSYLGIATAGFPNMFMILGPNGPFTNLIPSIEVQVRYITDLVREAERRGGVIEVTQQAEDDWTNTCRTIADMTLFPKTDSWIFGANIPGKQHTVMFYLGGLALYRGTLAEVTEKGFEGFSFKEAALV